MKTYIIYEAWAFQNFIKRITTSFVKFLAKILLLWIWTLSKKSRVGKTKNFTRHPIPLVRVGERDKINLTSLQSHPSKSRLIPNPPLHNPTGGRGGGVNLLKQIDIDSVPSLKKLSLLNKQFTQKRDLKKPFISRFLGICSGTKVYSQLP